MRATNGGANPLPFRRQGAAMWQTKETLAGGLRIDRSWWAAVQDGTIVAVGPTGVATVS